VPRSTTLSEAAADYRGHLVARGLSRNTVKNNMQALNRAAEAWGDIQIGSISGQHIDRLFRREEWAASTRNLYLGFIRAFFTWCRREGHMARDFDPTAGWGNVRVPRVDKMRLPLEEFPTLLDACVHPRDRMICSLGIYTFLRGSEIVSLRISDADLSRNELHIFRHKTREQDVMPISVELAEEFDRYYMWYRRNQNTPSLRGEWHLTPAKGPNPTRQNVVTHRIEVTGELADLRPTSVCTHPYRAVQRALARLGYETKGEGEHTLRRSGARALFDTLRNQGYDGALMRVSSMLGHRDTRVTERYIGLTLERTQRNEMLAGQVMFPSLSHASAEVIELRSGSGDSGA
jgi:integrase